MVLIGRYAVIFLLASVVSLAQVNLSLASGSAYAGGAVSLDLLLSSNGTQPAALQWTLDYSTASFTSVQVTTGPTATAAGKQVTCAASASGSTCILVGMNLNTISSGVVAVATFQLSGALS